MSNQPDILSNPLFNPPSLRKDVPALDVIKTEHFMPAIDAALAEARQEIAAIRHNPARPDFKNTIEALLFAGTRLNRIATVFGHIAGVASDDAIRALEEEIDVKLTKFGNDVSLDDVLFHRVKAVYDARGTLTLDAEQKTLLEKTYKGYVRGGALLSDPDKQTLRDIDEKLAELSTRFGNNKVKAMGAYQRVVENEAELAGVPDRAKDVYRNAAEKAGMPGKWLIKLAPPPSDIFQYAANRALREEIHKANAGICYKDQYDNSQIVVDIATLRHRRAQVLGFATHADYVLDDRMSKTPANVHAFLQKNLAVYKPEAEKFLQQVRDFAAKEDGLTDLKPWDVSFYVRRLQEKTFGVDLESLRPYFELGRVLDGLRQHAEKLFNIEMKEAKGAYPVNDPDVKVYEIIDRKTGDLIGVFYADYYARPGAKKGGAWMNSFRERGLESGENKIPLIINACNYQKPAEGTPTLLDLDDVRTLYHEFGHGLHGLLAEGKYTSLNGTHVKWDFVELPSQLQENWAKTKEVLNTFARHHETGEPLSDEMIEKINEMENFGAAYYGLRQTFFGLLDMAWHNADPATIKSVEDLEDSVIAKAWLFPRAAGTQSTQFGHLFHGGYSAGYYSYKWAEVLEADVFELFQEKGLYDRATADRLRQTIYSQGGKVEPDALFRQMMGRDPDVDALFRREGLLPPKKRLEPKAPPSLKP